MNPESVDVVDKKIKLLFTDDNANEVITLILEIPDAIKLANMILERNKGGKLWRTV